MENAPRPDKVFNNLDLTKLLIKEMNLKSGYYELSVGFIFSAGGISTPENNVVPGISVGITGIGLQESTPENPNSVNAEMI